MGEGAVKRPLLLVLFTTLACGKKPRADETRVYAVNASHAPCSGYEPAPPKTQLEGFPAKKVADLPRDGGRFDIEGVVTRAWVPVPCPEGADCKPQMSAHVVVGDVVLYTPDPKSIPQGVSLRLSLELCSRPNPGPLEGELRAWTR